MCDRAEFDHSGSSQHCTAAPRLSGWDMRRTQPGLRKARRFFFLMTVAGAGFCLARIGAISGATDAREAFDQVIIPAVTKTVQQSPTQEGGDVAWNTSYQLSALVEMLTATRDSRYAALIVKLGDWIARARDDQQQLRDAFRDQILPAWSSTNYSAGKRYTWAVHTGMIAAPLAQFAALVRRDARLELKWGAAAGRLLQTATAAVAVHDTDYREGPGSDEGHLYSHYLQQAVPLNMQNALARAWLAIDDATGTPAHRHRIARLARFLKHRLRPMADGAYVWAYWPPLEGAADSFEDISHAAINVDFMVLCQEHGIVFTREDLLRLEKTLLNRVLCAGDQISNTVGGGEKFNDYRSSVLLWGRLGRHVPAVHERLKQFSQSSSLSHADPAWLLGFAYLSLPPSAN